MYDYRDDIAALYRETYQRLLIRDTATFAEDRARFEQQAATAWEWRYLPAVAANYRVRQAKGQANAKDLFRLAEALVAMEDYDGALELFAEPMPELEDTTVYWYRRGEALLGAGRLAEAQAANARAGELSSAKEPRRMAPRLDRLEALQAASSWADAAELVEEALLLGARSLAATMARRMAGTLPAANASDAAAIAMVARAALQTAPEAAEPLIAAVRAVAPDGEDLAALEIERALRAGRAEEARAVVEARGARADGRDLAYLSALATEASGDRAQAIRDLGPLSSRFDRDHDIRSALARFCGEDVLARRPLTFAPSRASTGDRRRVINLIPFNNEMTMLDTRLREMADWVDLFVIVEAAQTFTGGPKACGFDERKAEFAEWGEKIRHVKLDAFPDHVDSAWARDCWQRDMAIEALGDGFWAPDDIVLLTDSDEIVRGDAVAEFEVGLLALKMKTYRYFFNYEAQPGNPKNDGHTGVICTADQLAKYGSSYIRFTLSRPNKSWNFIQRAGWHFTSMGDAATLVRKFTSYAHQEKNKKKVQKLKRVSALLDGIRAGQFEAGWARCEIDESFPSGIRESQEELRDLIL
ncbi:MAG: hypothetical protein BGN86_01515 [Caulobacterales bacterium 68-7]|nr:MAG: hypothetical protein BGN86_01515 [Caulobacterales bacterium 68-7]